PRNSPTCVPNTRLVPAAKNARPAWKLQPPPSSGGTSNHPYFGRRRQFHSTVFAAVFRKFRTIPCTNRVVRTPQKLFKSPASRQNASMSTPYATRLHAAIRRTGAPVVVG